MEIWERYIVPRYGPGTGGNSRCLAPTTTDDWCGTELSFRSQRWTLSLPWRLLRISLCMGLPHPLRRRPPSSPESLGCEQRRWRRKAARVLFPAAFHRQSPHPPGPPRPLTPPPALLPAGERPPLPAGPPVAPRHAVPRPARRRILAVPFPRHGRALILLGVIDSDMRRMGEPITRLRKAHPRRALTHPRSVSLRG